MNTKTQYWIDSAGYDMNAAKAMYNTRTYLYVGFMCHQTIEKAFKAAIAENGEMPPKAHNLISLAKTATTYDTLSEQQKHLLNKLNPLNIETRYPHEQSSIKSSLTKSVCRKLIAETEELLCWTAEQLA